MKMIFTALILAITTFTAISSQAGEPNFGGLIVPEAEAKRALDFVVANSGSVVATGDVAEGESLASILAMQLLRGGNTESVSNVCLQSAGVLRCDLSIEVSYPEGTSSFFMGYEVELGRNGMTRVKSVRIARGS